MKKKNIFSGKLLKICLLLLLPVLAVTSFFIFKTKAQTADTETITTHVTVGNTPPAFKSTAPTGFPKENTASTATVPTAIGSAVNFRATAIDDNGESYFLTICSTNSITPVNGSAGNCASGAKTYCKSTSTTSGSQASCSYTTLAGDPWSNDWYAFVCDSNSTASTCSASHQGSGDSGSPFFVSHPPAFTAITNNTPVNPGQTVTWTATASDLTDEQQVKLLVCKTAGITAAGACTGGAWCTSSNVNSNPSCSYSVPVPTVAGTNNAYVYVVDTLNTPATGTTQGSNSSFVVSNVAPTIPTITLNGGQPITLTESAQTPVVVTASVVDNNGCSTLSTIEGYIYRSGVGYSGATGCGTAANANDNNCYRDTKVTCIRNSCTGTTAQYTCTANIQYFADPTTAGTQFPAENWLTTVKATDSGPLSTNTEIATGVEMNALIAFDVSSIGGAKSVEFGNLDPGKSSTSLVSLTTRATGNVGLDQSHHSTNANMCTNFPTCTGGTPIPITNQRYSILSSATYASATPLGTTANEVELNVNKPTSTTAVEKKTYWGILIPTGTLPGSYSGVNTITAILGEIADW